MKNYKLYKVGGVIRDQLLGVKSKDIDYTFEFTPEYLEMLSISKPSIKVYFITMRNILIHEGFEIFLETPEAFTIRARFPEGHQHEGLTADFVLARKETYPDPTTRMPVVEIGNLYDDQLRRDFTVNSIAEDEDGNLIDPFDGQGDIKKRILRCPVSAEKSFNDDPLRMLRALRFSITKGFSMDDEIERVIETDLSMWTKFLQVVSEERIREELNKMFKHDTPRTLRMLFGLEMNSHLNLLKYIFGENIWLKPTTEKIKKK